MSSIALAKQLQKQGKHEEVIALIEQEMQDQALKEHLKLRNIDKFELLEARSYSLQKLRRWNSAKDDARQMIILKPKDPRGYLRKGHIYYDNGYYGKTVQAYRQAIKFVDKTSKMYEKLSFQLERIKKLAVTRFVDPVTRLPPELLISIFKESLKGSMDVVRLMLVSKTWCKYIESEPKYWSNLHFNGDRAIPHQTIDRYLSKSGGHALHLRVSCLIKKSNATLRMLKKYKNMVAMQFESDSPALDDLVAEGAQFPYLSHLKMGCKDLGKMLCWSLENLSSLQTLDLFQIASLSATNRDYPNIKAPLKNLTLTGYSSTLPSIKKELMEMILQLNLQSLSLHRVIPDISTVLPCLQSLEITKFGFTSCCNKPSNSPLNATITAPVRHLTLNKVDFRQTQGQPPLPLEYLEAKWNVFPPEWGISTLLQHFACGSTIESLILERNSIRYGKVEGEPEVVYPNLRNLYIVAMPIPVTSQFIDWICRSMPVLQFANFNETPIDGRSIVKLVRLGVKQVRCRNAGSIDPETLNWARDNGSRLILG